MCGGGGGYTHTHTHTCACAKPVIARGRGKLAAAVENLTDAGESNMCVSPGSIDGPAKCHARGIPSHRRGGGRYGEFAETNSTKPF